MPTNIVKQRILLLAQHYFSLFEMLYAKIMHLEGRSSGFSSVL